MTEIPATWMRGGTSKCWIFRKDDLAAAGRNIDDVLLRLFGSPDPRQVDGVGGGTSTTSKAVILAPSARDGVDVEYTFAQVGIDEPTVDWGSNCGNCSAVVAPFAIREGWVEAVGDLTEVRVLNMNTDQLIIQHVPTRDGALDESPTTHIPGVPLPGAPVHMGFISPAGRSTGTFLPSGRAQDELVAAGVRVAASMVDAGAPVVLLRAEDLGLSGAETATELDGRPDLLALLDALRREGAVAMGLVAAPELAARAIPKVALVGLPTEADRARGAHLAVRMLSMGRVHPALPITGSVALTLAARSPGTVVADLLDDSLGDSRGDSLGDDFRMLTPAGLVSTSYTLDEGHPVVSAVRTYRRLAQALLELPAEEGAPHAS